MYKKLLTDPGYLIVRESDNASIPIDSYNADYADFLQWMEESKLTIDDIEVANPPVEVAEPDEVPAFYNTKTGKMCYKSNGQVKEIV